MLNIKKTLLTPRQWTWNPEKDRLENPKFGYIQVVDVCDGEKRLYQQPIWSEARGEVNVIVNDEGEIAFVEQERHAVILPQLYAGKWKEAPEILQYDTGATELELPRGFANALLAEAEEETRYKAGEIVFQTHICANTSFFATSPFVVICRATKIPAEVPSDPNEKIRRVLWLSPKEVRKVETICSFTYSALWIFRLWALKQQNDFWRGIGEKL